MKRIIALCLMFVLGSSVSFSAYAQDESSTRASNPGDDPNEAMKEDGATVAAYGTCKQCMSNLWHGSIDKNSLPKAAAGAGATKTPTPSTQEGTR